MDIFFSLSCFSIIISMVPSSVNLIALLNKLEITWFILFLSANIDNLYLYLFSSLSRSLACSLFPILLQHINLDVNLHFNYQVDLCNLQLYPILSLLNQTILYLN
jgi:hypothetical protein